jgi:hypothetical protein
MVYKIYNMIGSQGYAIISPMGPNAFTPHNLAPHRILNDCTPDEFTRMGILHPSGPMDTNG